MSISNAAYDPTVGAQLYNRYLDEKIYAEEMGFDGLMLNEHHSTPFCMQGVTNVGASILARVTKKVKIVILGNILPIWDDPLWLAETLAMIDMISYGRLVSGFVRGGGRESVSHNAPPHYNRERFEEAHDFLIKTWTTPGPFRWEGKHFHYRYVNPWARPFQQPHPPVWVPFTGSKETIERAAHAIGIRQADQRIGGHDPDRLDAPVGDRVEHVDGLEAWLYPIQPQDLR